MLIENVFVMFAMVYAVFKTRKGVLVTAFFATLGYIIFNLILLNHLQPTISNADNSMYYWLISLYFTGVFGVFMFRQTRLSVILGGCVLAQAILSFFMALNGAVMGGYLLPEFDFVYTIHKSFNGVIWIIECIVVYVAATTDRH
jgi:hypothetical protein